MFGGNITFHSLLTYLSGYLGIESFWDIVRTIVDVGLVAFVFYKLMLLLRDSRAWQIIKGVIIILFVSGISNLIGLTTISYLAQLILQILPVLIVVIFQPEIRRALEGMGKGQLTGLLWGNKKSRSAERLIDEVVKAAVSMAKGRVGALIIFERETNLGEIIRTGTIVDAEVSSQLLQLIFVPNTPLHDGAVIIRDNKIFAAACFLPLSADRTLSKELGTRHRAGLGVTENADCVSVIVSEETGQISVAKNGVLTRNLSEKELNDYLRSNLVTVEDNADRRWFAFKRRNGK